MTRPVLISPLPVPIIEPRTRHHEPTEEERR
jgi:hypothetical protein